MRRIGVLALFALALLSALAAAGCSARDEAEPDAAAAVERSAVCPAAWRAGWQRLANRIGAPVYCPSWIPNPLTGEIGGSWNTVNSVDPDRSYLVGFAWQEVVSGEVHVNFRGYPGRTAMPQCLDDRKRRVACFSDPRGRKRIGGLEVTMYTRNRDADEWHVLYAWRHGGSLYTISEHISPPLTYRQVLRNLDRMLRGLVLVRPKNSA